MPPRRQLHMAPPQHLPVNRLCVSASRSRGPQTAPARSPASASSPSAASMTRAPSLGETGRAAVLARVASSGNQRWSPSIRRTHLVIPAASTDGGAKLRSCSNASSSTPPCTSVRHASGGRVFPCTACSSSSSKVCRSSKSSSDFTLNFAVEDVRACVSHAAGLTRGEEVHAAGANG